ncbi:DNA-binding SARP family transcriptional activator [Isoptericola jiangsuensis]|uniref:DNA-binding SARP family transcriptional activator n=1 Tax=Isoptericola jiangsuensis TaxID=548579 RepID=A0A2A9ERX0_9MICO|nr:BTAD domain-containing putative transcriptional regulator [Isoptericola jiangsuensis]PFG41754.1 DNA-binding SARP family transcriptional activator [Isoptericola jiangsuensis]
MTGPSEPAGWTTAWSLRLLGGWSLEQRGVPVPLHGRERRLLAVLALRGQVPRTALAGELWPDSPGARAHLSLRTAVHQLRHGAPGLLQGTPEHLSLDPAVVTDVGLLCRCTRGGVDPSAVRAPVAVLASGALLPEWDDQWLAAPREHVEQHRLAGLESEAARRLDRGDPGTAAELAALAVAIDPLRETAHYLLVRALLATGNRARAILAYRGLATTLGDELGVSPSLSYDAVVAGGARRPPSPRPVAAARARPTPRARVRPGR